MTEVIVVRQGHISPDVKLAYTKTDVEEGVGMGGLRSILILDGFEWAHSGRT